MVMGHRNGRDQVGSVAQPVASLCRSRLCLQTACPNGQAHMVRVRKIEHARFLEN